MHSLWLSQGMENCPAGILHCLFWGNVMSKAPRHPVPSPGRWGHLDVFYRAPKSSSMPLPCLHPWLSWRPAHLTQDVTHTSSQPLFSDLHFFPVLYSTEHTHTHSPLLNLQPSTLKQAQQLGSGAPAGTTQEKDLWASERIYCSRSLNNTLVLLFCRCTSLFPRFLQHIFVPLGYSNEAPPNCNSINSS